MIKGFIFDLDGTVFDTERMLVKYWHIAGKKFGYDIKENHIAAIRSTDHETAQKILEGFFGSGFNYKKIRDLRRELMNADIEKNGIPVKQGAEDIFKFAKENNVKCAIATATDKHRTQWYLQKSGLTQYIYDIATTEDVPKGKPYPDIYLFAAGLVGCMPKQTIAFEDSPNGIKSAYRAGCCTVFVKDLTDLDKDTKKLCSLSCSNLNEALDYIEKNNLLEEGYSE